MKVDVFLNGELDDGTRSVIFLLGKTSFGERIFNNIVYTLPLYSLLERI